MGDINSNVFDTAKDRNIRNFNLKLKLINDSKDVLENYLDDTMLSEMVLNEDTLGKLMFGVVATRTS